MLLVQQMKIRILPMHAISVWLKPVRMVQALYLDRRLVRPSRHFSCKPGPCVITWPETVTANISAISKPILMQFEANLSATNGLKSYP